MKGVMFEVIGKGELDPEKWRKMGCKCVGVEVLGARTKRWCELRGRHGLQSEKDTFTTRENGTGNRNLGEELGFCSLTHRPLLDL